MLCSYACIGTVDRMMGHIKWGTLNKQESHLLLLYLPGAQNQFSVNLVYCSLQIASIHGTPQKFNTKLILQLRQERCPLSLTILCAAWTPCMHASIPIYQQSMTYSACYNYQKISFQFILLSGAYGILSLIGNGTESGYLCIVIVLYLWH